MSSHASRHISSQARYSNQSTLSQRPKYVYEWLWGCCYCQEHAGMSVDSTPSCPGCGFARCENCLVEYVQRRCDGGVVARGGSAYASKFPIWYPTPEVESWDVSHSEVKLPEILLQNKPGTSQTQEQISTLLQIERCVVLSSWRITTDVCSVCSSPSSVAGVETQTSSRLADSGIVSDFGQDNFM